jgi:two-component system cell cycle response regulator DivK
MDQSRPGSARNSVVYPGGAADATVTAPSESPIVSKQPDRALLVGTDSATLRLCRDVLARSGFIVDTAGSGVAALISARDRHPDLIIMDLQLPDVAAREAVSWLRGNPALQATPIIVLTPTTPDDRDIAAIRPAASLRKPVSAANIQRAIRQLCERRPAS